LRWQIERAPNAALSATRDGALLKAALDFPYSW
jgi:hypothetical protein